MSRHQGKVSRVLVFCGVITLLGGCRDKQLEAQEPREPLRSQPVEAWAGLSASAVPTVASGSEPKALVAASSGPASGAAKPEPVTSASTEPGAGSREAGAKLYRARCVACHGPSGRGDGPAAASLEPRPLSLKKTPRRSDAELRRVLIRGGPALGLSPAMPGAPDLAEGSGAADMIAFLRSLR